ncbi:hypothetical protein KIW84_045840, partial [Lathyrus oleraceus]
RVLGTGNLDKGLELELYQEIEFERLGEGYDEGEGIDIESNEIGDDKEGIYIQNQKLDLNENCYRPYDCLIVSKDVQAHDNPQEKENLKDDDNSKETMKSEILHNSTSLKSGEETETSSNKRKQFEKEEDSTGGSSDVELSINKVIKVIPVKDVPNKLNPNSSMAAESSSSKPSSSEGPLRRIEEDSSKLKKCSTSECSPVDYSEYKRILEEDPLEILEKLLSDELGRSSQASHSSTQAEATEIRKESIETLLDELRQLAFSRNLLKNLPNDVTLEEEVKALLLKLNFRANELSEKQSSGIADFTTIFNEATVNIDEGKRSNVTLQQLNVDHKDSISKLQASKIKIRKFEESIIAGEDKIKAMDIEIEDIKAQIFLLEEKARKVQQEKSQLEDACWKCKEKRSEILEEAKYVASKTIQTREKIDNVKKKKLELDSNYDVLEGHYAIMRLSPPF